MSFAPHYVIITDKKIEKFINDSRKDASEQYDASVAKLVKKIGPVTDATLDGDHVWNYSILTVAKENGQIERWKTQMIINVSKLGKLFNQ